MAAYRPFLMSLAGKLVYQLCHRPVAAVRFSLRHGGPLATWKTERGRAAMEAAATSLPALNLPCAPAGSAALHLLTGSRFWW